VLNAGWGWYGMKLAIALLERWSRGRAAGVYPKPFSLQERT
jgi:hypothetical protein